MTEILRNASDLQGTTNIPPLIDAHTYSPLLYIFKDVIVMNSHTKLADNYTAPLFKLI